MNNFNYYKYRVLDKLFGNKNKWLVNAFRKEGMEIGKETHIFSNISLSEPYLIKIGNNCTISTDVSFITHDASIGLYIGRDNYSDICGRIEIGDNCFIGSGAIILYGVTLPDNTLVAAGSVVTKSINEPGCIIAGNPAKIISKIEIYLEKNKEHFLSLHGLNYSSRKNIILESDKLIKK